MATHIASFPIRPTHVASNYLAITCRADTLISLNQIGSPLLHTLDPDAIDAVYNHVVRDRYGNYTIPALATASRLSQTCKLMYTMHSDLKTPFDVVDFQRSHVGQPFHSCANLNAQSFRVSECATSSGAPGGVRLKLSHVPAPGEPIDDPVELVLVRHLETTHARPVSAFLMRTHPVFNGDTAMEVAIDEAVNLFSGHSKMSLFKARTSLDGIDVTRRNFNLERGEATPTLTILGDDELLNPEATEQDLVDATMNPCHVKVSSTDERLVQMCLTANGNSRPVVSGHVDLVFADGDNIVFANETFRFDRVDQLAVVFGALGDVATARMPTHDGDGFISDANLLVTRNAKRPADGGIIDVSNVLRGRRQAAKLADFKSQRIVAGLMMDDDGLLLPGHPQYASEKAKEDAANAQNAALGAPLERFGYLWHAD